VKTAAAKSADRNFDTILIYCSWVFSRWQWSVNLCKNRKET